MDIIPGDMVYGHTEKECFQVIQPIGNGAFGIVYEVRDANSGNRFALKTIVTAMLDSRGLEALINEGNLASGIENENVLRVFYFHDGNKYPRLPPYMLMEFADGGTLEYLINDRRAKQAYFSNDELRSLFMSLASGMKAINEKLVHRDVKPDNILFANGVLKISDFGLSKVIGAPTRTQTFKGINHVKYCAPEAWHLEKNTPAMDMYSMGIVFYELATLTYPYSVKTTGDIVEAWKNSHLIQTPQPPNKINTSLDTSLTQLVMKMIAKRPEDRYSTWDEVIHRLGSQLAEPEKHSEVVQLVQKAIDSHNTAEQERLEKEEGIRRKKEYEEIISYCFQEIIQVAQSIVDEFNAASEFAKLELRHLSPFAMDIRKSPNDRGKLIISIMPLYEERKVDNLKIKAWGFTKAPSGRGFNLLLVEISPDDIYGEWRTFHVGHSAVVRHRDNRPVPFPFELNELPEEIKYLNAIHVYTVNQGIFKVEFLHPLIEELL
jgi:eukaryotic-like serine/threonine-protein kinase